MRRPAVRAAIQAAQADATEARRTGGGGGGGDARGDGDDVLPPNCPVRALGLSGTTRFYLDAQDQLVALEADKHGRSNLVGLFGGSDYIWGIPEWCRCDEKGKPKGIRPEAVADDLIKACHRAGPWDPTDRERGRGAWTNAKGELILHLGGRIMVFSPHAQDPWESREIFAPGVIGDKVFPKAPAMVAPAEETPWDDAPAGTVLEMLETWSWQRADIDPVLMLGWVAAAMIGGALAWRPMVWITGGKGTGKSKLQELIKLLLGGALIDIADTTGAYLWQQLRLQTLPVAIDEAEAEEDNRRLLGIVKLARLAASGGRLGRGSERHAPVEFMLRSCMMFTSILRPPLQGADRSRFAFLELQDLPATADPSAVAWKDPDRVRRLGALMRRALIDNWSRADVTLTYYHQMLIEAGHSRRTADQFGALLACADLVLFEGRTDVGAAEEWARKLSPVEMNEITDDQRDEDQCLQHLLGIPVQANRSDAPRPLGHWINVAADRVPNYDPHDGRRVIQDYGVRLEHVEGRMFLAVANNNERLCALFERTRWNTPRGVLGAWVQALRRLPGSRRHDRPLYFGGPTSRATLVPFELIPRPDGHAELPFSHQ